MTFTLMSWILAVWLVVTCLSVAVPVWKRAGQPSGPSRRSLLIGLLEAASLAGLLRLVVPWTSGSVVLWVVAVVALAVAVAGAVLRWPELPGRVVGAEGPNPHVSSSGIADQSRRSQSGTAETAAGPGVAVPGVAGPGVAVEGAAVPGVPMEAAPVERSRRPFLPVRERVAAPGIGNPGTGKSDPGNSDLGNPDPGNSDLGKPGRKAAAGTSSRKTAAGKKVKKEPGNLALAGNAALLLAVVVLSFLAG